MIDPALATMIREASDAELQMLWRRSVEVAEARFMRDGRYPGVAMYALRRACNERDVGGLAEQDDAFQSAIAKLLHKIRGAGANAPQTHGETAAP